MTVYKCSAVVEKKVHFLMSSYKYSVYNSAKRSGSRNNNSNRSGGNKRRGEYINPAKFVAVAKPTQAADYEPKNRFEDFDIELFRLRLMVGMSLASQIPVPVKRLPLQCP